LITASACLPSVEWLSKGTVGDGENGVVRMGILRPGTLHQFDLTDG